VACELAALSSVDLAKACSRTIGLWQARALALHHLAEGDMDEAVKVMAAATDRQIARDPEPNQPPNAAKENHEH